MQNLVDTTHVQMNLNHMINELGEDEVKTILSSFSCNKNKDVEDFIRNKAILFSNVGIAKTHLIFWKAAKGSLGKEKYELVGYFSIAPKTLTIKKETVSHGKWKKICKFGDCSSNSRECKLPALLIGQLAKNYHDGNDTLLKGDELLALAIKKVKAIQSEVGGRIVYLECEDDPRLIAFYERNEFIQFGKRELDLDETNLRSAYLVQLFRYL